MAGAADEDAVREYANDIRKRLNKNDASIRHHITANKQHYWLVVRGNISAHGKTPGEALDNFEKKLTNIS